MKNTISILTIVFLLACGAGCGLGERAENPKTEANTAPNKPATSGKEDAEKPVRSTDLVEAFRKDKEAANAKYKDKIILISGKITNINDVFGVKALNLRDGDDAIGLQTYLANTSDVEKVKVGDEVTVRGKVRGDALDVIDNAVIVKVN